jgi:hypothetical protein
MDLMRDMLADMFLRVRVDLLTLLPNDIKANPLSFSSSFVELCSSLLPCCR